MLFLKHKMLCKGIDDVAFSYTGRYADLPLQGVASDDYFGKNTVELKSDRTVILEKRQKYPIFALEKWKFSPF